MSTQSCLRQNTPLKPPYDDCKNCKHRFAKWYDKPEFFYGANGIPNPNCVYFSLKYKPLKRK